MEDDRQEYEDALAGGIISTELDIDPELHSYWHCPVTIAPDYTHIAFVLQINQLPAIGSLLWWGPVGSAKRVFKIDKIVLIAETVTTAGRIPRSILKARCQTAILEISEADNVPSSVQGLVYSPKSED